MADWDDARFVLALSRTGTIRAAALSLSVNHTTVSRRIATMEEKLSARLFEQTPSGYVLTASGQTIVKAAERMEELFLGSQKRIEGSDSELSGDVHIHIPDIFDEWVCELLAPFSQTQPNLRIHLSSQTAVADLARREADIALRFTNSPPQDMVGRKVWELPVAVYASTDFEFDPKRKLSYYPWVRWADDFKQSPVEIWTDKTSEQTKNVTRVSTYRTLSSLISHGAGIGCLSPWFAENDPNLKRISPVIESIVMDVWVLIHPDLRGVRRIKEIKDLLTELFDSKQAMPYNG